MGDAAAQKSGKGTGLWSAAKGRCIRRSNTHNCIRWVSSVQCENLLNMMIVENTLLVSLVNQGPCSCSGMFLFGREFTQQGDCGVQSC